MRRPPLVVFDTGWYDLPLELCHEILQFLNEPRDLAAAALVSRDFHSIVKPLLYERARVVSKSPPFLGDMEWEGADVHRQLRRFTRTMLTSPHLGRLVRELELVRAGDEVHDYEYWADSDLEHTNTTKLSRRTKKEYISSVSWWFETIEEQNIDTIAELTYDYHVICNAIIDLDLPPVLFTAPAGACRGLLVLLLHRTPELRRLKMSTMDSIQLLATVSLGGVRGGVPPGLKSLRELQLSQAFRSRYFMTEAIAPFMCLDNLRSLSVDSFAGLDEDAYDDPPPIYIAPGPLLPEYEDGLFHPPHWDHIYPSIMTLPVNCSRITSLTLTACSADSCLASRLLYLPLGLEQLTYEVDGEVTMRHLVEGIRRHADTLRSLSVHLSKSADKSRLHFGEDGRPEDALIGSIRYLTYLEYLSVSIDFVLPGLTSTERRAARKNPLLRMSRSPSLIPPLIARLTSESTSHLELKGTSSWPIWYFILQIGPLDATRGLSSLKRLDLVSVCEEDWENMGRSKGFFPSLKGGIEYQSRYEGDVGM